MATLKEIRKRIGSVKNTQQITRAMKMVSGAKLRRAEENIMAARPYAKKIAEVVTNIARRIEVREHPLIAEREIKTVNLMLITSDRGLCGAFNMNLVKEAVKYREESKDSYEEIGLSLVGKKGADYFKKRKTHTFDEYLNLGGKYDYTLASKIGDRLIEGYCSGEWDAVCIVYSEFKSAMTQIPTVQQILPIPISEVDPEKPTLLVDYIYEPSAWELLDDILPRYVKNQVFRALLDTLASEHGARMVAMDSASTNASEMIDKLTLKFNRVRQSAITKELMEIIGGAEALKD